MRGPEKMAVAVRQPDGEIFTEVSPVKRYAWQKIPIVRGVGSFIDSLLSGYKCLMKSAEVSMTAEEAEAEQSKFDRWLEKTFGEKATNFVMAVAAVLGGVLAIALFMVLPTFLVGLLDKAVPLGGWKTVLEGVLKIAIVVAYMALVGKMPEIDRMFRYHGAEHKTISCYEAGKELTVENIRPCSRFHPRCGTSFILIILIVSILVFSAVPWAGLGSRVALKLICLPLVMGVSYEILKFCGRHDNWLTRAVSAPGMWLQHITVNEPDDSMIECAIAAVLPVLPENREDGKW